MTWKLPSVTSDIDLPYPGTVQDKKPGLWSHMPRVQVPTWPLTGWVTGDKFLNLLAPIILMAGMGLMPTLRAVVRMQ